MKRSERTVLRSSGEDVLLASESHLLPDITYQVTGLVVTMNVPEIVPRAAST
jgi:hypothetical protein